jgi:methylated-DNA-[protein]-cysteine S-methyltransferase
MMHPTEIFTNHYLSPLGPLRISVTATAVQEVTFCSENEMSPQASEGSAASALMQVCIEQLDSYFCGKIKSFELPLTQPGTAFQQRVWNELLKIPYGATISYLELSRRLGNEKAIRAAASTNGKNRIAVIVPCHRVIGSNQQLVGYAGGLSKKKWLLEHELRFAFGKQTLF